LALRRNSLLRGGPKSNRFWAFQVQKFNLLIRENLYLFSFVLSILTFISVIIIGTTSIIFSEIYIDNSALVIHKHQNWVTTLFLLVVISPLWETFIFQGLIIYILRKIIINKGIIVFVSAIIFALAHLTNSYLNAIQNFTIGILLAFAFLYWKAKSNDNWKGFESTMLIHSLHNLYQFGLSFIPAEALFKYF